MLETGIRGKQSIKVTENVTAKGIGSGELPVFATPAMIELVEETAWKSVAPELEEGQGTVGAKVVVSHVSATPVGLTATCETELIDIDRRRLVFMFTVSDDTGKIGEGTHERFIIDNDRFLSNAEKKLHRKEE